MAREYSLTPRPVPRVETAHRRIVTDFPAPESLPVLERLRHYEPRAMAGQPPVVWHKAHGATVEDPYGNRWIDWSSGVLVTNAGHAHPRVVDAIVQQAQSGLLTNYCFPSEIRGRLAERLATALPAPLKKVFLLTTGSETVECAIKLSRMHGAKVGGPMKRVMVSYERAFHGRTLGSQQAGGIPALKEWIGNLDPGFVQVPFPESFPGEETPFAAFEQQLADRGIAPQDVAGVIMETYQGGTASFAPLAYIRELRAWCDQHQVLLTFDEVQAGFGRCGTMWGFQHYEGVLPDLTTWGKGVTSSLPLAFVAGRPDVMDLPAPGSMTSTHTGNPVCCAAALASLDVIEQEGLVENARVRGQQLQDGLSRIMAKHWQVFRVYGKGMVAGVLCTSTEDSFTPDGDLAFDVVRRCVESGVLLFSPVGPGGATVKICPPLCMTEAELNESLAVLDQAFAAAIAAQPALATAGQRA